LAVVELAIVGPVVAEPVAPIVPEAPATPLGLLALALPVAEERLPLLAAPVEVEVVALPPAVPVVSDVVFAGSRGVVGFVVVPPEVLAPLRSCSSFGAGGELGAVTRLSPAGADVRLSVRAAEVGGVVVWV